MKNFIYNSSFAMIACSATLMGCGSQSMKESVTQLNGLTQTGVTTTPTPTGNINNFPAATESRVELGGNNSADFQKVFSCNGQPDCPYSTARTMRVKIKPLPAPNITVPDYTNWVFPYGCLSVSVTVNGMTRGTQVLRVEGVAQGSTSQCASAPTSQILDFTDVVAGNGTTQIVISNANYDNCRQYWPLNYGCSMSAIWQNHRVALNATIQTDGTYME